MKAQFVFENIEFERGRDPKKAMSVGARANAIDVRIALDERGTFYPAKNKTARKILKRLSEDPSGYKAYEDHVQVWIMDGKKAINRVPVKEIAGKTVTFMEHLYILSSLPTNESVDFERGKDPRRALQVGLVIPPNIPKDGDKFPVYLGKDPETGVDSGYAIATATEDAKFFEGDEYAPPPSDEGHYEVWANVKGEGVFDNEKTKSILLYRPSEGYWLITGLRPHLGYYKDQSLEESIDFERGKDPKEALGIGLNIKILKRLNSVDLSNMEYLWYDPEEREIQVGPAYELDYDLGIQIEGEIKKHFNEFITGRWDVGVDGELGFPIHPQYHPSFNWAFHKQEESQNFERGKDPKDALNIGSNREIKKGEKFIAREYNSERKREVIAIEDSTYYEETRNNLPYQDVMVTIPNSSRPGDLFFAFNYGGGWDLEEVLESQNFERGKDPKAALDIGAAHNAIIISSMDVEYRNEDGGGITPVLSYQDYLDAGENTWTEIFDDDDYIHHLLANWEEEADYSMSFNARQPDADEDEYWHAPELEGEWVRYQDKTYKIPKTSKWDDAPL